MRDLVQSNLLGKKFPEKDSKGFGNLFPRKLLDNSSIMTFQNISQLSRSTFGHKSIQISKAFINSNASITLYPEPSINN